MRNVELLELLLDLQEIELALSSQGTSARIRRQVAWATFTSRVNQLGAEDADWKIGATNAVVVETILDGRDRRIVSTYRQQRRLRGTGSVKLDQSS
jgi:hypothetical protein